MGDTDLRGLGADDRVGGGGTTEGRRFRVAVGRGEEDNACKNCTEACFRVNTGYGED